MEHLKWWYALPAIKLVGMVGIPLAILGGASCIKGCEDKKAQKASLEEKVGFRSVYETQLANVQDDYTNSSETYINK